MKIADVKAFPVRAGLRNLLIVKVESDDGHYGWGESGVVGRELAVEGAVRHFREFLIGKDPRRSARFGRRCTAASTSRAAAS